VQKKSKVFSLDFLVLNVQNEELTVCDVEKCTTLRL
jgi:hypothetical protein